MVRFYLNNFIPTNKSMSILKCLVMKIHFKKLGDRSALRLHLPSTVLRPPAQSSGPLSLLCPPTLFPGPGTLHPSRQVPIPPACRDPAPMPPCP